MTLTRWIPLLILTAFISGCALLENFLPELQYVACGSPRSTRSVHAAW